jgi:hypothetical protein
LLECQLWGHSRTELRQAAGERWGDLSYMLGGHSERKDWKTGRQNDGDREKWKPNHAMVKVTINFLQLTGRIKGSYEVGPSGTSMAGAGCYKERKKEKRKNNETQNTKQNKRDSSSSVAPSTLLG